MLKSVVKTFSFIILFVISFNTTYGQIIYSKQANATYNFSGIYEDPVSDNLLITNYTSTVSATYINHRSNIFKIDKYGVLIDSIALDSNLLSGSPVFRVGNNYFVTGGELKDHDINNMVVYPVIYKYDLNFNLIKKCNLDSYSNDWSNLEHVSIKQNKLYAVFGLPKAQKIKLFKLDLNLNKLDSSFHNGLYEHSANYGNKLLLVGSGFPMGSSNNQVVALDTNFNVLNRFNLDSLTSVNPSCFQKIGIPYNRTNVIEVSNNKYVVSGFSSVTYTFNGTACLSDYQIITGVIKNNSQVLNGMHMGKQWGVDEGKIYSKTIAAKKHNYIFNIATSGHNPTNPFPPQSTPTEIMVNKIDTAGNIIWSNFYNTFNYYYAPLGVCGTSDSGVVVTGIRYNVAAPAVFNVCEGFVMKLDKNGVQQYVGVFDKSGLNNKQIKCYPNPAINKVFFDLTYEKEVKLEIYNSLGQLIFSENKYESSNAIDISYYENSIYYYRIYTQNKLYTGKFIKE